MAGISTNLKGVLQKSLSAKGIKEIISNNDDKVLTAILIWVVYIVLSIVTFININIVWLKIWLTPKLYLIEYSAELVKTIK